MKKKEKIKKYEIEKIFRILLRFCSAFCFNKKQKSSHFFTKYRSKVIVYYQIEKEKFFRDMILHNFMTSDAISHTVCTLSCSAVLFHSVKTTDTPEVWTFRSFRTKKPM